MRHHLLLCLPSLGLPHPALAAPLDTLLHKLHLSNPVYKVVLRLVRNSGTFVAVALMIWFWPRSPKGQRS